VGQDKDSAPISEETFLAAYDPGQFDRPSVTVDVALLSTFEGHLETVLVKRTEHPQRGSWALPGGFVAMDESLEAAAMRVLAAKAGIEGVFIEQLYTFGDPSRDPRTRIITVAYYALVDRSRLSAVKGEPSGVQARLSVEWEGETGGPVQVFGEGGRELTLAFDHADILGMAVKRIRGKLDYTPIGFQLLPETFTLRELQVVHETVLSRPLNKDSFRRRMLASGQLEATGQRQRDVGHRPAELYRFSKRSAV
jgi:8-oxo-dGTP diphosphatase